MIKQYLKKLIPENKRLYLRSLQRKITWPFYIGNKYHCSFCGLNARKFLPFYGRDSRCPRCNSIDRYRLLWLYLETRTNILTDPLTVLHFAPEKHVAARLRNLANLKYTTADLMASFMDGFCVRPDVEMDIRSIEFPDASFDVILCNHVLEHVKEDRQAMAEIYRVLKKGGWAILQVPIDQSAAATLEDDSINTDELRTKYYGADSHVRMYGLDYKDRLESVGFKVSVDQFVMELDKSVAERLALDVDEDIYVVHKA